MTRRKLAGFALLCTALGFACSLPNASAQPNDPPLIRIGMVKAFFNDVPNLLIGFAISPFEPLMKQTTGLDGKLLVNLDNHQVAQQLNDGQIQLGVFHGHELAWAQKKYPKLTPFMVVVNQHRDVRAIVIVNKDNPAKSLADLRGKTIDIPLQTKEPCLLYLRKHCTDNAQSDIKNYFDAIKKSATPYDALDDLCKKGCTDAVVLDTIGLEFYKEIKKFVYAKNLRILQQSEPFPSAVIAYKQGALDESVRTKIHAGLLKAHELADGKDMMKMWNIEAFEAVPSSYTKNLADVLKEFPTPEPAKVGMR